MYPTSIRFRETISGSHQAVTQLTLLNKIVFGPDPRAVAPEGSWWDLPLHDGSSADVSLNSTADITGSLGITVPGEWWDVVQPYGAEVHAARGVNFGDGTTELVPLGYFRINRRTQDDMPYGPVVLDCQDRTAQLAQVRVALPWQIPAGTSHRAIFRRLLDGSPSDGVGGYGMYGPAGPTVPVDWTGAGYDPDTTVTTKAVVVEDDAGKFLSKMVGERGAVIVAKSTGELAVLARDRPVGSVADFTLMDGPTGTLVRASRSESRDGVFNVVRATGSDPAKVTGYRLAYNTDPTSAIRYNGPFGPAVRYYASPLLGDSDAADEAAETILARSTGLPEERSLWLVPDPSVRPLDTVEVVLPSGVSVHVVEDVGVPLTGNDGSAVRTRTLNSVPSNPEDPEPDTQPQPDPVPGGGTTTPPPGPGGGDPSDGTQAAIVKGWGAILTGDEFTTAGDLSRWGLYNGPGHGGNGLRRPSAFTVHDGMMTIHGSADNVSGGTAFKHRQDGRGYRAEVRARVYNTDNSGGDRYHPVLILWPDSDNWPAGAEYDFFECDEGDGKFGLFMHLPNHTPYRQDHYSETLDIQNWHNYAVDWNARDKILAAYIDGREVYRGTGRVAEAPGPMHLTVQLDHFGGNPRAANFDIAWVRVYQRVK